MNGLQAAVKRKSTNSIIELKQIDLTLHKEIPATFFMLDKKEPESEKTVRLLKGSERLKVKVIESQLRTTGGEIRPA